MNSEFSEYNVLKVEDLMERLGLVRDKAYMLMKSSAFPSTQIGKTYFVTVKNFNSWLDSYTGKKFAC